MKKTLLVATLAAISAASQAATIFSDNFDSNSYGLNATPNGWTVSSGTVDIIGQSTPYDLCGAGHGLCIDLDGSSSDAGILSRALHLTAGVQYTARFDLAGNQRGGSDTGTVTFGFGSAQLSYSLASGAAFSSYEIVFMPMFTGTYNLSFANAGTDNVGALLDNVVVTTVPEPETYALLLAGLGLLGAVKRRKAKAA